MSPTRRPCFFCGGSGKRSAEHVWRAKWRDHFGAEPFMMRQWGWVARDGQPEHYARKFKAAPFSETFREVCTSCNNGWMNALENEVEVPLLVLASGARIQLGPVATAALTRWAAKTAYVIAGIARRRPAVSQPQKDTLRGGGVPSSFNLWVLPLPPDNATVQWRSTSLGLPVASDFVWCRVTSWDFMAVHFLVTHFTPPSAAEDISFQWVLGRAVTTRSEPWICPPPSTDARPDVYPDYHSGVLRHLYALLAEQGIQPVIGD